jgi:lysine-N-methylase
MPGARFKLPMLKESQAAPSPSRGRGVPLPDQVLAARFLEEFQCIGGACEDVCCRDWMIAYDKPSYERLRHATPLGEQAALEKRFLLGDGVQMGGAYAFIQPRADGWCSFLDESKLCEIQQDHGEKMLSESCSIFPRTALAVGDRVELGGSLACPEVARHLITTEDGGDLIPGSRDLMPRQWIGHGVDVDEGSAYERAFDVVRNAVFRTLANDTVPLMWRRLAIADVAEKISSYFQEDVVSFDNTRLIRDLARFDNAATLHQLGRDFERLNVPLESTLHLVVNVLQQRITLPHSTRYQALLASVLDSMLAEARGTDPIDAPVATEKVAAVYQRRRDEVMARFPERTELLFTNYVRHFWTRSPYTHSPSLLEHVCRVELRVALLRFLYFGHPQMLELLKSGARGDDASPPLDAIAVEVMQIFAKAFEHAETLMKTIDSALDQAASPSFARVVMLGKF